MTPRLPASARAAVMSKVFCSEFTPKPGMWIQPLPRGRVTFLDFECRAEVPLQTLSYVHCGPESRVLPSKLPTARLEPVDEQYHIQAGKRTLNLRIFLNVYVAPDGVLRNSNSTVRLGARISRAAVLAADFKNNRRS